MSDPGKRRKEKGQAKENTLGLGQCRIGVTLPPCTASTSCAVKRPSSGVQTPLSRQFPPTYHIQTFSSLPLPRPPPTPRAARASCLLPFILLLATFPSFRKRFKGLPTRSDIWGRQLPSPHPRGRKVEFIVKIFKQWRFRSDLERKFILKSEGITGGKNIDSS